LGVANFFEIVAKAVEKVMEPAHVPEIRPLTETEIAQLEAALGKPVERAYLVYWVSAAIRDVVRLSAAPTPREYRDELAEIAHQGRNWIQTIEGTRSGLLLPNGPDVGALIGSVTIFCEAIESVVTRLDSSIRPGKPRTPFALETFLDRLIGIAKRAKVLPSTPGRALRSETAPRLPPPFYNFVTESLEIAIEVIKSSPLPDTEAQEALAILASVTDGSLGKILERLRGRIGDYHESADGLTEGHWHPPDDGELNSK
jgi:hypothetical protein